MSNCNYTTMSNQELLDEVNNLNINRLKLNVMLKKHHQELFNEIVKRTSFLTGEFYVNEVVPMLARLYCLEHGINSQPICNHCRNPVKWRSDLNSFATYCSMSCMYEDEKHWDKVKKGCIENIGVDNPGKSKIIHEKMKKTRSLNSNNCSPKYENIERKFISEGILELNNLKEILKSIVYEFPNSWSKHVRKEPLIMDSIKYHTPLLQSNEFKYLLPTMVYWVLNGLNDFPIYVCPVCGNEYYLDRVNVCLSDGYSKLLNSPGCNGSCIKKNPIVKKKCEDTCIARYGKRYYLNNERAVKTLKERYGDNIGSVIQKRRDTCIKLYGTPNGGNIESANEKRRQTNLRKRGVEYSSQDESVKKKKEETYMRNLGVRNPLLSDKVNKMRRKRWILYWNDDGFYEYVKTSNKLSDENKYDHNMKFDSTWEIKVFMFCFKNNIQCQYQPDVSFNYECHGKQYTYHPDFIINDKIYEVKGNQFFKMNEDKVEVMINPYAKKNHTEEEYKKACEISEAKHQCMLSHNVIILRESDIKNLELDTFFV